MGGFGHQFFLSRPRYAIRGTGILGQIASFKRRRQGGGSNVPRHAVSVPHLDVNADGCRTRQARSCHNIACRGGIPDFLFVSSRQQRQDDLRNWHHSQTKVGCYCNVLIFAVAYSRSFVLLDVCRALTNDSRKSLRGAAPRRSSLRGVAPTAFTIPYPMGTSV